MYWKPELNAPGFELADVFWKPELNAPGFGLVDGFIKPELKPEFGLNEEAEAGLDINPDIDGVDALKPDGLGLLGFEKADCPLLPKPPTLLPVGFGPTFIAGLLKAGLADKN